MLIVIFFFFNDTATTEIYTLSLHDALPISCHSKIKAAGFIQHLVFRCGHSAGIELARADGRHYGGAAFVPAVGDRKSTRLNSRHSQISYAGFCLKKKKKLNSSQSNLLVTTD